MKGTITLKILDPIDTLNLKIGKPVDPKEFFKTGPGIYVWSDFISRIVEKAQTVEVNSEYKIDSWKLESSATDEQIEQSLESGHIFSESEVAAIVAELISKQSKGKDGALQNNGYSNLFYTPNFVVGVHWGAESGRWRVSSWPRRGRDWRVDDRVFSPAT